MDEPLSISGCVSGCLTYVIAFASLGMVWGWFGNAGFPWAVGLFFATGIAGFKAKRWRYFFLAWVALYSVLYGVHRWKSRNTPEYVEYPRKR